MSDERKTGESNYSQLMMALGALQLVGAHLHETERSFALSMAEGAMQHATDQIAAEIRDAIGHAADECSGTLARLASPVFDELPEWLRVVVQRHLPQGDGP